MPTIEVTDDMVEAGIDAVNKLRMVEAEQTGDERVAMSWADLLSVAYAAMETCRRRREMTWQDVRIPHRGLVS